MQDDCEISDQSKFYLGEGNVEGDIIATTSQKEGSFQGDVGGSKVSADIKADVTDTVNCGSEDCFTQKFKDCKSATLTSDAGFGSINYKIIGPAADGCKMTVKYPINPNPVWVNKEMTCTFNNKISLQDSVEKVFNGVMDGSVVCEGPLYAILKSQ